jgi:hypothetical protein
MLKTGPTTPHNKETDDNGKPVPVEKGAYIFMADRWGPQDAIDGRYIRLPAQWNNGVPFLQWKEHWNLEFLMPMNRVGNR